MCMSNRSEMDFCPGVGIGHVSLGDTGVSVLSFAAAGSGAGAVASVDVRGGGPGTRETDLLAPENTVGAVQAIVLAGGSAYGLAAADGAMAELESRGAGFRVFGPDSDGPVVPIVPAAVIFDLAVGDPQHRPTAADGQCATARALENVDGAATTTSTSNIGAGCGATAGKLRGGFGQASREAAGYRVSAAVVANPVGEVVDAATGRMFGAPERAPVDPEKFADLPSPAASLNTTIGVIATNAPLSKAQLRRLAMCGHDGISWAVRPAHSPLDGDTLFAVSTAAKEPAAKETADSPPPNSSSMVDDPATTTETTAAETITTETMTALCAASSQVVCDAIVHAVVHAEPGYGLPTYSQLAMPANSSN